MCYIYYLTKDMRKIFTFLTLFFFTANTLVWGAPADAATLLAGTSRSEGDFAIIHIQDAHSNYEVQKSIREILSHLHDDEGVSFVALEGAWQPLAPNVYHFFPDAKSNLKVADYLAQKGEMSGAELYALELSVGAVREPPVHFEGVEDAKIYREDYELFKKVLARQDEVKKYYDDLFAKLDVEKSKVYSSEFLRFDRNIRDYENKHLELAAFLRILEKSAKEKLQTELTSPDNQREWPYLCRMLRVMNASQGLNMKAVEKDAAKLCIDLNDKSLAANPRGFFESVYLDSLNKGMPLDGYQALRQYSEHLILKSEIIGPELFAEMDSLIGKLSNAYAANAKEKELLNRSREARLTEKLLKFEATGREWQEYSREPWSVYRGPVHSSLSTVHETAFRFYQLAEQRNQILLDNTLAKMKSRGVKKAVLITGGFHSRGIETLAKQKNISYRTIQPKIREEFSNQRYRDAVLGTWWRKTAESKIPKPLWMVQEPDDAVERSKIIRIAIAQMSRAASLGQQIPNANTHSLIQPLTEAESHQLAERVLVKLHGTKFTEHEPIIVNGRRFGFESDQEFDPADPWFALSRIIRLGPLVFVVISRRFDAAAVERKVGLMKQTLGDVFARNSGNIFFIQPTSDGTETNKMPLSPYSRSMIAAMLAYPEKFKGAIAADFGAGDGLLSRIALGLGAKQVFLIERDAVNSRIAEAFLRQDGRDNFIISSNDITSQQFETFSREYQLSEKVNVVLANLGPWKHYGDANQQVLNFIARWKNIELLINGGYGFPEGWIGKAGLLLKGLWHVSHEPAFKIAKQNLEKNLFLTVLTLADAFWMKSRGRIHPRKLPRGLNNCPRFWPRKLKPNSARERMTVTIVRDLM
ncbi:MAG: class I SAM-dependent methyltransferase [Candidatus Omnitrophica bacterium]|nr:class I SAM-dependent methyltransferase [Candidatus Omnitrophota bacterium]